VRNGGDIFKALALGANFVFVGRPSLWALTCGGEAGVEKLYQWVAFGAEFDFGVED